MASITEQFYLAYRVRREISQVSDLATMLLARLQYDVSGRIPSSAADLLKRLQSASFDRLTGTPEAQTEFASWLNDYLTVTATTKGVSLYPVHPALALATNGEHVRVEAFVQALASCFTWDERTWLVGKVWSGLPAFESALHDFLAWQMGNEPPPASASSHLFAGCKNDAPALSPEGILARAKEDILALAQVAVGVQSFVTHGGRLLAFALARYLLAQAGAGRSLPIYAAPAADTHEGVKTLAHEIIEVHRAEYAEALHHFFDEQVNQTLGTFGITGSPADEATAQAMVGKCFSHAARIIPAGAYGRLLAEHGSFANMAYDYYWSASRAVGRFLRQLHTTHLNVAKKAGFANSRSSYSQWHFYWLAPTLVETLVLLHQARYREPRILVGQLLDEWRERYGLTFLIDGAWEEAYRLNFRTLGNPETLNEANRRRFQEILAEQGRLHKNSDDFPWVVLRG